MPKVSVIMSVYNAEKYIKETINSVLNQNFEDFEFIIINDGSTDSSKDIILSYKDPRIQFIENKKNIGLTKSLNRGLKLARGEYIARIDADDVLINSYLKEKLDFIKKNPGVAMVGSWAEVIDMKSDKIRILEHDCDPVIIKWTSILKNQIAHSSAFFRKKILEEVGYYRERYKYAQDFDLWFRISRKYKIANIAKPLIKYRVHKESITQVPKKNRRQKKLVAEIIFNNINYYTNLDKKDFEIFRQAWKDNKIFSFKNFIKVRRIYKNLFNSYIRKENLNREDIKKIFMNYKVNKNSIFKQYLIYKFPKFYKLFKKYAI